MSRPLAGIAALALVLRVAVVLATPDFHAVFDALDYSRHAVSISEGDGYPHSVITASQEEPSAFRPPAYPYLLGLLYAAFGASWTVARLAGAVLGALAVVLLAQLASRLFGERAGLVAGGLAAVFPPLVFLSASLTVESLFIPLTLASLLALLAVRETGAARWAALAGVLVGLTALARFNGLALLLVAAVAVIGAPAKRLRAGVALGACVVVVLAPWAIRSSAAFDSFVPLGTQGGYAIAGVYNSAAEADPEERGAWRLPNAAPELRPLFFRRDLDERELDSELRDAGAEFAREHPGYVAVVVASNTWRMLNPLADEDATRLSYEGWGVPRGWRPVLTASWFCLLALALAGAVAIVLRRAPRPSLVVWLAPLALAASLVWIAAEPRYRTAIDPFAVLAAAALAAPGGASRKPHADPPRRR